MITTRMELRQGDLAPSLTATLETTEGAVQNLIGATVTFTMKRRSGTQVVVNAATAVVTDPVNGGVRYDWGVNDTATIGTFNAVFRVTLANNKQVSFPNNDEHEFVVEIIPPA